MRGGGSGSTSTHRQPAGAPTLEKGPSSKYVQGIGFPIRTLAAEKVGGLWSLTSVRKPGLCCHLVAIEGSAPFLQLSFWQEIRTLGLRTLRRGYGVYRKERGTTHALKELTVQQMTWPKTQHQIPTRIVGHEKFQKMKGA